MRLGVRRLEFDVLVKTGFVVLVGSVEVDDKRQGGVTAIRILDDAADLPHLEPARTHPGSSGSVDAPRDASPSPPCAVTNPGNAPA